MNNHSILPPSSAARRMACPGSRRLEYLVPNLEDSPISREGTAAHWVSSQMLQGTVPEIDTLTPTHEFVTQEMIEGAKRYTQEILKRYQENLTPHLSLLLSMYNKICICVEETIPITEIHPECFGIPDCWFEGNGGLFIFDYKFGFDPIEAFENWQMLAYSIGIIKRIGIEKIDTITLIVVQPRDFKEPIKRWTMSALSWLKYRDQLIISEKASMNDDAACIPNPECGLCSGRSKCAALRKSALTAVEKVYRSDPFELNSEELGNELKYLKRAQKLLESRISGLEQEAISLIKKGERVPNFTLEAGKGREYWKKSKEEIKALAELFDCNIVKTEELITPRQAIAAGMPEEIVKAYCEAHGTALKLKLIDEKSARKLFD